jgi:hypothetical protein
MTPCTRRTQTQAWPPSWGINDIKPFYSLSLMLQQIKLECLPLSSSPMSANKADLPWMGYISSICLCVQAALLISNVRQAWKNFWDNHSSLICWSITKGEKKFFDIDTRGLSSQLAQSFDQVTNKQPFFLSLILPWNKLLCFAIEFCLVAWNICNLRQGFHCKAPKNNSRELLGHCGYSLRAL